MQKKNIIVAITGASGAIYANLLVQKLYLLREQCDKLAVVLSSNAKEIIKQELRKDIDFKKYGFTEYSFNDFNAPFASGSSSFDTMIICPSSMGTIGRIAAGVSTDIITRAADVFFKERKKIIIVPRETPYSLIHLKNMTLLTESGAIICPATPSFYSMPKTFEELALTVVDRVIDLTGLIQDTYRWRE